MDKHTKPLSKISLLAVLSFLLLTDCKKPAATSVTEEKSEATETTNANSSDEKFTDDGYPIIAMPAGADTSMAYWKGIDLSPKPPVLPLTVEEQQAKFVLMNGYKMDAVISEPDIQQPGAISFDGNGRMYVLELRSYMIEADSKGTLEPTSGISRWEDTDNDGVYETGGMFVDNLVFPRFVLPYGPDCILTMESNQDVVYKYTDTDGDGKADKKEFFTNNYGRSGNVEHQQGFMYWSMDNWLYSTVNPFRVRETASGVVRENTGSNHGQWGISHDDDGKLWFQGGASGVPSYFQFPIHLGDYVVRENVFEEGFRVPYGSPVIISDMQGGMRAVRQPDGSLNRVTGAAGNDIYRGDRLPKDLYGQLFYGEPVARIVRQINPLVTDGLTMLQNVYQEDKAEFIRSTDPLFRPVDMTTAPDGSMYITDMYHGIIQEGQWAGKGSYLRAKIEQYQLDKVINLGRIWRLTHNSMERDMTQPKMFEESSEELVAHLSHPNGWWRDKAQQLLVMRKDKSIVPDLEDIVRSSFDLAPRFHALWVLEGIDGLSPELVREMMNDPQSRMRNMAMWVSETLYKNGDRSFAADYRRLIKDANSEVKMRAMMTAKMLHIADLEEEVKAAMLADTTAGVALVGKQILEPPVVHSFFGRSNPNHSDEQKEMVAEGQKIYTELCSQCHGTDGRGTPVGDALMAPSFVNNNNLKGHSDYVIKTLLHGLTGDIEGKSYEGVIMVPMAENSDEWMASVTSFIRYAFENEASLVSAEDVARVRDESSSQTGTYQYADLKASVPTELQLMDDWNVTASHSVAIRKGGTAEPKGAFTFEGWTTGIPQTADMWFQVELPESYMLNEIQFKSQNIRQGNFRERLPPLRTNPRILIIETSMDGNDWTEVWTGETHNSPNIIRLESSEAKFLRMKQTGSDEKAAWSMEEMKLYGLPKI